MAGGRLLGSVLLGSLLLCTPSFAAGPHGGDTRGLLSDSDRALAYSQAAVGRQLGPHRLLDVEGHPVELADLRGKPLVISFVYTSCAHTCPLTTQTLARAVDVARDVLGTASFQVLTIGFDSRADTPQRMAAFARTQGISSPNWRFLSGDAATIARFAAETGFLFEPLAGGFAHLAQTTLVDAEGRVYRQIYEARFPTPALVEPLKDLVLGRATAALSVTGLFQRLRFLCTVYDPAVDRYRFSYAIVFGLVIGAASLSAVGVVLFRSWRQSRGATSSA